MNNDLYNWLRDFANANEGDFDPDQIRNLLDAACEIRDLHETVNELTAWNQGVEADNDTLRNEIQRLHKERGDPSDNCTVSFSRADADSVADRPLTDEEWNAVKMEYNNNHPNDSDWQNLSDTVHNVILDSLASQLLRERNEERNNA
jgi:hypothetical protein